MGGIAARSVGGQTVKSQSRPSIQTTEWLQQQYQLKGSQAPSNPTKYKKPKRFRFNFKETEKVQWKAFGDAMNIQLLDPEKMKTFGINGLLEEDADQIGRLKKLDIEEAWRWYSSVIMECAKYNLPGRVVGRSGVKPKSELSVLSMIWDLCRIKKLAKTAMADNNEGVSSVRDEMVKHQVKFNTCRRAQGENWQGNRSVAT
ncbi:hypothetical protein BGX21_007453, partial [Mortierella sp. AD011]